MLNLGVHQNNCALQLNAHLSHALIYHDSEAPLLLLAARSDRLEP